MLRISWQSLRARRTTLAGAFVAILLAVTFAYATGLLMAGALSAPGPGRLAAADAVVRADPAVVIGHGEDAERVDAIPGPTLPASAVARASAVPGVARAVGDVAFPAGVFDAHGVRVRAAGADRVQGHGWPSARLTPYRLSAGHAPAGPRQVVADARLGVRPGARLRVVAPGGAATYRVSGVAAARAGDRSQAALFFAPAVAGTLSGAPGRVGAVGVIAAPGVARGTLEARLRARMGAGTTVVDRAHAADADAGDRHAGSRTMLVAVFGTLGGVAGAIALFVVAGTFGLAIAQRRRETAVLRALGATPRQVRRLIAGEALIVSLLASALGLLAGGPLADAIARAVVDHGWAPAGFGPGASPIPIAAALGLGVGVAQLAVVAAAHRAGRVRPAEALREAAIEHARPGVVRLVAGMAGLGGGIAMAVLFDGEAASAFAILGAMLSATGVALLGRWSLGLPAALLAWPLRRLGAPGLLAATGLAANRWRTAALATPIALIAMLVATQGVLQASDRDKAERVTAARVTAGHVLVAADGAPLPAGAAGDVRRLAGVRAATATVPTQVFLLGHGLTGWDTPWPAAGVDLRRAHATLALGRLAGDLRAVHGGAVAVSEVVATEGGLKVGDTIPARMADTRPATLTVAAIYRRATGLGDLVLDPALVRRHDPGATADAVLVDGTSAALDRYAAAHPGTRALSRAEYLAGLHVVLEDDGTWGVWLIIGMSLAFTVLALVNTAAMATAERRGELATLRLLGATRGQARRMLALELAPTVAVGLLAGVAVAALALVGVPHGVRGIPLVVPTVLTGGLLAGAAILALAAGGVTGRLALRVGPAAAMRGPE